MIVPCTTVHLLSVELNFPFKSISKDIVFLVSSLLRYIKGNDWDISASLSNNFEETASMPEEMSFSRVNPSTAADNPPETIHSIHQTVFDAIC